MSEYCLNILENANSYANSSLNLDIYQKYMLLNDSVIEALPNAIPNKPESLVPSETPLSVPESLVSESEKPIAHRVKLNRYTPRQQNSLFWCLFIFHYGIQEYEMIGTRYQNAELEEKYRISEALEKSPELLKSTNYSPSKQTIKEMCASIVSSTRDDFFSLIAFCAYYKCNVFVAFDHSRTYLEFNCGKPDAKNVVLRAMRLKSKSWAFDLDLSLLGLNLTNEYAKLNTYMKPIKGIGSYKSDELIDMATKMNLTIETKDGKKELYEKIGQKIGELV